MNELDPDLKRLLRWARAAEPGKPAEAPFGFASRVLAARKPRQVLSLLQELQGSAWGLSWVSLALILCGALVWFSQRFAPLPTEQVSTAVSFLARNLPQ